MKYDSKSSSLTNQRKPEYSQSDEWIAKFLHETEIGQIATRWDHK